MGTYPTAGRITRRGLLAGSAGIAGAALLGACSSSGSAGKRASSGSGGPVTWWDHNVNLQKANGAAYARFTEASGVPVTYTYIQAAKLAQALQLAHQSKQQPDVHSIGGLGLSVPALIADGWFSPIDWDATTKEVFGKDGLVEGLHIFDEKIYTFPIFTDKQYFAAQWFHKDFIAKAGIDTPPETYDTFRDACRKVMAANKGAYGFVFNLGQAPRLQSQVNDMAQAAGFAGADGTRFTTGEIAFHDDAYLTVIDFLKSLQTDKLVFPGSSSLDDQTARARWAAGAAGYFMDGPWCSGTVQTEMATFLPQVDVGPMLRPDAATELVSYRGRGGGNYFISGSSTRPDVVADLLGYLPSKDYNTAIANAMAQPPYDLSVVASSTAIEPWKRLVGEFPSTVYIAPQAALKNPSMQLVAQYSKPVKPGLPEIVQGYFSGDVTDLKKALTTLSSTTSRNREAAITKANGQGAKVSPDDYAFANWKAKTDYTADQYH